MFSDLEKQSTSGHTDIFGDMYEYLLSKLSQAGTLGSFRTPRHIIKFIVDVIDPKKGETILDPACGTAGFLVAALKHLEEKYTSEEYKKLDKYPMDLLTPQERDFVYKYTFTGFDSDFDMFKFGLMNLYLHKLEHPNIKRQNTLVDTAGDRTKWDVILANPPFAGALDIDSVSEDLRMGTRSTELLFLRYMMDHLSSSGRAGVIVPEGVVFNSTNAHKKIRQMLVEDAGLWCVVSLPGGIFNPYAGVKTSILFFDKSLKNKVKDILFVKVENDGFDLGATKRAIEKNDLPEALNWINGYKELLLKPLEPGLKPALLDHGPKSKANIIPIIKIIENGDYSLDEGKYQDNVIYTQGKYQTVTLKDFIATIAPPKKILKSEFLSKGTYPIIDQSQEEISGWTNEYSNIIKIKKPVVIFGDHTCCVKYSETDFAQGADGIKIIETSKELLPKYLFYVLKTKPIKSTGYKRHFSKLKEYRFPLPPLEIQKQIVEELDGYQKIIDGAKQIIENWKPSTGVDSSWEKIRLGDLCDVTSGGTPSRNNRLYWGGKIPWIKTGQINYEPILYAEEFITEEGLKNSSTKIIPAGTILMAMYGQGVTRGRIAVLKIDATINQACAAILIKSEKLLPEFLFFVLESMYDELRRISENRGGNQSNLNAQMIKDLMIPCPSLEIQKTVAEKVNKERIAVESVQALIENFEYQKRKKILEVWGD
jgi:type I restriction enzyme M protein